MYCSKCGNEIADNAKFCPKCGNRTDNGKKSSDTNYSRQRNYISEKKKDFRAIVAKYKWQFIALAGVIAATALFSAVSSACSYLKELFQDPFIKCDKYYQEEKVSQNYAKALKFCTRSAKKGNVQAQKNLGEIYISKQNYKESAKWYEKAAEKGDSASVLYLSYLYYENLKDYSKALKWSIKAAEQGNSEAELRLAKMYYNGIGGERNYEKAFEFYKKAAGHDILEAMEFLADCYFNGKDIEKDTEEGIKWHRQAIRHGSTESKHILSEYFLAAAQEQKDNESEAIKLYEQAAEIGNTQAAYYLAELFSKKGSLEESLKWYESWYEQGGNKEAQAADVCVKIAKMYAKIDSKMTAREKRTKGTHKDDIVRWYENAAEHNSMEALNTLVENYYPAKKYPQKYLGALQKMSELGNAKAEYKLGRFYAGGFGGRTDDDEAYEYFSKAAEKNVPQAQALIIYLDYKEGDNTTITRNRAKHSSYIKNLTAKKLGKKFFDEVCVDYENIKITPEELRIGMLRRSDRVQCNFLRPSDREVCELLLEGITRDGITSSKTFYVINMINEDSKVFRQYYNSK